MTSTDALMQMAGRIPDKTSARCMTGCHEKHLPACVRVELYWDLSCPPGSRANTTFACDEQGAQVSNPAQEL